MNGKTPLQQILHRYRSCENFPVLDVLRVEHLPQEKFFVFDDARGNSGRGTYFLVEMQRGGLQNAMVW